MKGTHPRSLLILLGALWLAPSPALAQNLALPDFDSLNECESVELKAESMDCNAKRCELNGNVNLQCATFNVFADHVTIYLAPEFQFNGATARGSVTLIQDTTLIRCSQLTIDPNRIKGRVKAAEVYLKKRSAAKDPNGRNNAILHGDFERTAPAQFTISDGDFTLCDCQEAPPSWRLDAPKITVKTGERATIWWPTFRINLFGQGLVPITPPLAPLSVPLQSRTMGMLAPSIKILGFPFPMVDVPFFIPLGRSYDLTLSPGMRFDWGSHSPSPSHWGASRLGTRFRYAPAKGWKGTFTSQWTFDPHTFAARLGAEDTVAASGDTRPSALVSGNPDITAEEYAAWSVNERVKALKPFDRHKDLHYRAQFTWTQHASLLPDLDWDTKVEWLSDDLIHSEFRVSLEERTATYLPSRTQLLWRNPTVSGLLAADHYLRLTHPYNPDIDAWDLPKNNAAHELQLPQRGPHLNVVLQPQELLPGLYVDAQGSFTRYGAWADHGETLAHVTTGQFSLRYLNTLGPLQLGATAQAIGLSTSEATPSTSLTLLTDLQASTRLVRRFGDSLLHTIRPLLRLRAIPELGSSAPEALPYDERTDLSHFAQAALGVDQTLYTLRRGKTVERLHLSILQPLNLQNNALLATHVILRWNLPYTGQLSATTSVDARHPTLPFREVTGRYKLRLGSVASLWTEYSRLAPDSDRYTRSLFGLSTSAAPTRDETLPWTHSIRGGVSSKIGQRLSLSYYTSALLPNEVDTLDTRNPRPYFTQHMVSLNYRSSCDCWGVNARVSVIDPKARAKGYEFDPGKDLSLFITLTIADYSLGT